MTKTDKKTRTRIRNNLNRMTKYEERVTKRKSRTKTPEQLALLLNPEDTADNPLTYNRLMEWLANTGWVYGYIRKRISPMDAHLYEDYAQTIWMEILNVKKERMMEVWYNGKGQFVNYLKIIIDTQLRSAANTYKINKHFHKTHVTLTDDQWRNFEEGIEEATSVITYPVKCESPTGNIKKAVRIETDIEDIRTLEGYLTDRQIHIDLE